MYTYFIMLTHIFKQFMLFVLNLRKAPQSELIAVLLKMKITQVLR